jgi:hypothetical protein
MKRIFIVLALVATVVTLIAGPGAPFRSSKKVSSTSST